MAEAWSRSLKSDLINPYSAGITAHGLNLDAIAVMEEAGIDCINWQSKTTTALPKKIIFDYVITLCDNASESCPFFPAATAVIHKPFPDPPQLARNASNRGERLIPYRQVRDEIKEFILTLPATLPEKIQ